MKVIETDKIKIENESEEGGYKIRGKKEQKKNDIICIACKGTGRNSKGGDCICAISKLDTEDDNVPFYDNISYYPSQARLDV